MIENTDLFNTRLAKSEWTEDGDKLFVWEVRAKGFAGVKAYNAERTNQMTSIGGRLEPLTEWTGCGDGWLKATYSYVVDGAEIAIEARNDAWASHQQEIEDAGRMSYGCW
jgi:hypothetical protein